MLDGIDYYPKKKKRIFGKLIWLFLFLLFLGSMWYYFQDLDFSQNKSSSIIISQPSDYIDSENKAIENTKETITPELPESNEESLDEIISNYETNSQN